MLALLSGLTAFSAGCKENVNVTVNCETVADPNVAVLCQIKQVQGKTEVEACWDFAVTCANGTVVQTPRSCAKVKDGGSAVHRTEADKLTNLDKCAGDKPPTAKVSNFTINGEAAKTMPLTASAAPATPAAPAAPAEAPAAPAKDPVAPAK